MVAANSGVPRVGDDADEDEPETQCADETTSLLPRSAKAKLDKYIHEFMAMFVWAYYASTVANSKYAGNCISRGSSLNCKIFWLRHSMSLG